MMPGSRAPIVFHQATTPTKEAPPKDDIQSQLETSCEEEGQKLQV